MESNEKKNRRPRIAARPSMPESDHTGDFNRTDDFSQNHEESHPSDHQEQRENGYSSYNNQRYQSRPYNNNRQGGYTNNRYGNNQRPYGNNRYNNNRYNPSYHRNNAENPQLEGQNPSVADGTSVNAEGENPTGGYQPRYPRYNNQGGYGNQGPYGNKGGYNNRRPGGYQPRQNNYNNRREGYQPRQQEGGYVNRQGGYTQNRNSGYTPRRDNYNSTSDTNGYKPRQNNYNNRQEGYQSFNREGGYNSNRQGYNNNRRQGDFRRQSPRQNQYGMPQGGRSFTPRPRRIEYEVTLPDPDEQIRLNKYMANAGLCSRREADEFIRQGLVKVNGEVVTELGTKITHSDVVEYDEKVVTLERKCYILLNKPKDCVTTSDDPNGRLTVMDLVKGACDERIYPVGRLDRNTTGVLLLTNDGDLASKLTHPKYVKKKIYHVWTDKDIAEEDMQRIADGIELEDGPIHADAISYATETDRNQAGIEIHSGRNRIVRRIFESLGYHVTKLDRVYFAGLTKKNLPRGRWRYLTQEEVNFLKMGSFEG